jgi:hypothetical protein
VNRGIGKPTTVRFDGPQSTRRLPANIIYHLHTQALEHASWQRAHVHVQDDDLEQESELLQAVMLANPQLAEELQAESKLTPIKPHHHPLFQQAVDNASSLSTAVSSLTRTAPRVKLNLDSQPAPLPSKQALLAFPEDCIMSIASNTFPEQKPPRRSNSTPPSLEAEAVVRANTLKRARQIAFLNMVLTREIQISMGTRTAIEPCGKKYHLTTEALNDTTGNKAKQIRGQVVADLTFLLRGQPCEFLTIDADEANLILAFMRQPTPSLSHEVQQHTAPNPFKTAPTAPMYEGTATPPLNLTSRSDIMPRISTQQPLSSRWADDSKHIALSTYQPARPTTLPNYTSPLSHQQHTERESATLLARDSKSSTTSTYRSCHQFAVTDFCGVPEVPPIDQTPWYVFIRGLPFCPIGRLNKILYTDAQPYVEILAEHAINHDLWLRDDTHVGTCYDLYYACTPAPQGTTDPWPTPAKFPLYAQKKGVSTTPFPPRQSKDPLDLYYMDSDLPNGNSSGYADYTPHAFYLHFDSVAFAQTRDPLSITIPEQLTPKTSQSLISFMSESYDTTGIASKALREAILHFRELPPTKTSSGGHVQRELMPPPRTKPHSSGSRNSSWPTQSSSRKRSYTSANHQPVGGYFKNPKPDSQAPTRNDRNNSRN